MRTRRLRSSWFAAVLVGTLLAILMVSCTPSPRPKMELLRRHTNRKVIISDLGEVVHNTMYVGDTVTYRIYYANRTGRFTDMSIVDEIDAGLEHIQAPPGSVYDASSRTLTWIAENVAPNKGGFVEFDAVIGDAAVVRNQARTCALIDISKEPPHRIVVPGTGRTDLSKARCVETNTVTTDVCRPPELGWVPFARDRVVEPEERSTAILKEETTTGLMVNFEFPGMFAEEVKVGETTYHRLSVQGCARTMELGKPELPITGRVLEIPHGMSFNLEVFKSEQVTLECYDVVPAQRPEPEQAGGSPGDRAFVIDAATYLRDASYPTAPAVVEAEDIGTIRGHRVIFLKAHPLQWNPVTKELTAYSQLEVRVRDTAGPARLRESGRESSPRPSRTCCRPSS